MDSYPADKKLLHKARIAKRSGGCHSDNCENVARTAYHFMVELLTETYELKVHTFCTNYMQQWYILLLLVQNDTWISIQSQCKTLKDRAGSGKFFSFYDFDCRASYTGEDVTVERPFYNFFFRWIKIFIVSLEGTVTNLAI